jgi:arylsulfatase
MNDTLIFLIIGDNGASAEGSINGTFNELLMLNGVTTVETPEFLRSRIDKFGSPDAYNHYAVGWAWAMDTPYQWTKQVASHWGGTRNGTIIHWPKGIKEKNVIRNQFSHVIDVAPTILEATGIPEPTIVNSVMQSPYEGKSMLYTFNDSKAPERRDVQYFEMFGNRGIYYKGWTAVTKHRTPWVAAATIPFDQDNWELYAPTDWSQAHDLSKEMPDKLRELQRLWLIEATKYNVIPLDDRGLERFNAEIAGRPQLIKGNSQLLFAGMGRLPENALLNIKNKSWSLTAEIEIPATGVEGVIMNQGGKFGGWSLYTKAGKAKFAYNFLGLKFFTIEADRPIPAGKHQVRMEFKYDGGGLAKGGNVTLYYDGTKTGEGHVDATIPMVATEESNVGRDIGTNVTPDYTTETSQFNGKIKWVRIDLGTDSHDHLISPEQRLHIAMTRQ